jgi:hypothetical protein
MRGTRERLVPPGCHPSEMNFAGRAAGNVARAAAAPRCPNQRSGPAANSAGEPWKRHCGAAARPPRPGRLPRGPDPGRRVRAPSPAGHPTAARSHSCAEVFSHSSA